jgi:hypothetical protein
VLPLADETDVAPLQVNESTLKVPSSVFEQEIPGGGGGGV